MTPSILVTGASGFSGSHLVRFLHQQQHKVIGHFGRNFLETLSKKFLCVHGDLTTGSGLYEFDPYVPDIIIHTAAVSPMLGVTKFDLCTNILMTAKLIEYAKRMGVKKIIYFSSISLYGDVQGGKLVEDSPIINPNYYGLTKLVCEGLLEDSGIPTVSLRLAGIVGKGSGRDWVSRIAHNAQAGEPVQIYNPAGLFNNVVHIDFLCEFISKLINIKWWPGTPFGVVLVASNPPITVAEVAEQAVHGRVPIVEKAIADKISFVISTKKLANFMTPWSTAKTIEQYVKDEK
jgi:nucleoside-diphosphate-sugar epimerase